MKEIDLKEKKALLVVGQTPPPFMGQAIMINRLVNAKFNDIRILHVRMSFSERFDEIGKSSWKKIIHIFHLIYRIWRIRLSHKKIIFYYPPAGPNLTPIIRDMMLLSCTRFLFSKTIYHFRAAGISEYLKSKNRIFQGIAKLVYGKPALAIQLSQLNPEDGIYFSAKEIKYIPNGMEDEAKKYINQKKYKDEVVRILFVGVLREDKGLSVLLEAFSNLIRQKIENIEIIVVGEFVSSTYKKSVLKLVNDWKIGDKVFFKGVQTGDNKWEIFSQADILCFPTFFDCESFGNVLVEAMMFQIPIVATRWRGIPDIITNDIGFLVEVKNADAIAEKLKILIENPQLRIAMGRCGREKYLEKYRLESHLNAMEKAITSI